MRTRIVKRGKGAAIRIPVPIMRAARLEIGQEVEIREVDGHIVIDPGRVRRYSLPNWSRESRPTTGMT